MDRVACCENFAISGVYKGVDKVFAEDARGGFVDGRCGVDEEVQFHDSVAGHVVEKEGHREAVVDFELFKGL